MYRPRWMNTSLLEIPLSLIPKAQCFNSNSHNASSQIILKLCSLPHWSDFVDQNQYMVSWSLPAVLYFHYKHLVSRKPAVRFKCHILSKFCWSNLLNVFVNVTSARECLKNKALCLVSFHSYSVTELGMKHSHGLRIFLCHLCEI